MTDGTIEVSEVAEASAPVVRLFDEYREHYGEVPDSARSTAWLNEHLGAGALIGFLAHRDGEAAGLALVAPVPASLRLGQFWQVRDLFVTPDHRRRGVAAALLSGVRQLALTRGATRLSLATESDNTAALDLYERTGFEPVTGYVSLSWSTGLGIVEAN